MFAIFQETSIQKNNNQVRNEKLLKQYSFEKAKTGWMSEITQFLQVKKNFYSLNQEQLRFEDKNKVKI